MGPHCLVPRVYGICVKGEGRASWDGESRSYMKEGEVGPWVLKENLMAEIGLGLG